MTEFFASPVITRNPGTEDAERLTLRLKWETDEGTRYAAYVREGMEQAETIDDGMVTRLTDDQGGIDFLEEADEWRLLEEKGLVERW